MPSARITGWVMTMTPCHAHSAQRVIVSLGFLMTSNVAGSAGAESIELTTYYPAPFGVYDTLVAETLVDYDGGTYSVPPVLGSSWFLDPSADGIGGASAALRGAVGIGTKAPLELLHVQGSGDALMTRAMLRVSSTDNLAGIELISDGSGPVKISSPDGTNDLELRTGSGLLRIGAGGNVSVGTDAPLDTMHVHFPSASHILVTSGTGSEAGIRLMSDSLGDVKLYSPAGSDDLRLRVGGADRLNVQAGGLITVGGLGITAVTLPSPKSGWGLHVTNTAGATRDIAARDYFVERVGKWVGDAIDATSGGDGDWRISGSNMYSIPPGNVGIGDSTPDDKLSVSGTIRATGMIRSDDRFKAPKLEVNGGGLRSGQVGEFGGAVDVHGDLLSGTHTVEGHLSASGTISATRIGPSPESCEWKSSGRCPDGKIMYAVDFTAKKYECCRPK